MKTIKAMVLVETRVNDPNDDDEVREAIKDSLTESIEDDTLDYSLKSLKKTSSRRLYGKAYHGRL